jgi:cytochrome c556
MSSRKFSTFLCALIGVAAIAPLGVLVAHDDGAKRTGINKTRHDGYHKMGDAFKTIRDQTKASTPDIAKIKNAAVVIDGVAKQQFDWFPKGSGPETGEKTDAKPEIWSDPQGFAAAQKLLGERAPKLLEAANSGDATAVKAQFGEVGKACKGCHDKFRVPEEH